LSELAVLGKPGILVPLPPGFSGSPQEVNADAFAGKQAAIVIRNVDLWPEQLAKSVYAIITEPARLQVMSEAMRSFGRPQATQEIAEAVVRLAGRKAGAKREVVSN
jgi:UDP-N-acetylglucosamine--N-acetylmuramyl-(pentapeptide) pyrophosphoryl-undecaprenol N-acetylglucosamine transferase